MAHHTMEEDLNILEMNTEPCNNSNATTCAKTAPPPQEQNNLTSSTLTKKCPFLVTKLHCQRLRSFTANLKEVVFGTKLAVLFPAVPLAVVADFYGLGRVSVYMKQNVPSFSSDYFFHIYHNVN